MALPAAIATTNYGGLLGGYRNPVHASAAGDVYAILVNEATDDIEVWKADDKTDPSAGWTEQDSGNVIDDHTAAITAISAVSDGTDIFIASIDSGGAAKFSLFQMDSDSWSGAATALYTVSPVKNEASNFWVDIDRVGTTTMIAGTGDATGTGHNDDQ